MVHVGEPSLRNQARRRVHGDPLAPLLLLHLRPLQMEHPSEFYPELVAPPPPKLIADDVLVHPRPGSWSHSMRDAKSSISVVATLDLGQGFKNSSNAAAVLVTGG